MVYTRDKKANTGLVYTRVKRLDACSAYSIVREYLLGMWSLLVVTLILPFRGAMVIF